MSDPISGEQGAYVPCWELPAPLPDNPAGPIVGSNVGYVPRYESASALPDLPDGAIRGGATGFVARPCRQIVIGGFQFNVDTRAHLATSEDAVLWNNTAAPFGDVDPGSHVTAAAWSPELGLFVIGGTDGLVFSTQEALLATSPDGITWTQRVSGFPVGIWSGINCCVWSPELGLFLIGGIPALVATSPDGITWTTHDPGFGGGSVGCAAWSPELGLFVIGGGGASIDASLATSPDGITWTQRVPGFAAGAVDPNAGAVWCAAWSPELGLFVIGGFQIEDPGDFIPPNYDAQLATSPDGITWTQRVSGFLEQGVSAAVWSPTLGLFLICSAMGNSLSRARVSYSADGVSWSAPQTLDSFVGTGINCAVWLEGPIRIDSIDQPGAFIVAGHFGQLWTSSDAITWSERVTAFGPDVNEAVYDIAIAN